MRHYRIVHVTHDGAEHIADAATPEKAALIALGLDLVRGGAARLLTAKAYWRNAEGEPLNMVRLYAREAGA